MGWSGASLRSSMSAGVGLLALLVTGCPSNMCLLTVNGRCEWSTCPDGAEYDSGRRTCVCAPGRVAFNGGCLTPQAANEFCGKGSHFENGGCVQNRCQPGLVLDQDTGYCLSPQQLGSSMGVAVGQDQKLACKPGEQLVVSGSQAACVPAQQTCARDEAWDGQACRKVAQCPPGSSFDAASGSCVRFASGSDQKEYVVDLPTWIRTAYGPDGGDGTSSFCGSFSKHPFSFGVLAGGAIRARITVDVQVPDVQNAHAQVAAVGLVEASGQPVQPKGAGEIQQAAQGILAPLVAGGGKASAAGARTTVRCLVVNAAAPVVVPASGGL